MCVYVCVCVYIYMCIYVYMNNSIRIIFIKNQIYIIKIKINNTHFIMIKYSITTIFIKIEYFFICIKWFLHISFITNQYAIRFNAATESQILS